jgi:hypothetical protein
MHLPRIAECCVACLQAAPSTCNNVFTQEHVIPRAIGGVLTSSMLCKSCNDRFGHTFEKRAKMDPAIRLAAHALKDRLPALFADIEAGQPYILEAAGNKLPGIYRAGEVRPRSREIDGDLWASHDTAERSVK